MKYIVEIKPEYEDSFKGVMILGAKDSNLFVDTLAVENLEELNSDYINEHFGDLQDTAYQRGLDDAWEAARKIVAMWETMNNDDLLETFGVTAKIGEYVIGTLFKKQTANEAMLKLEAYEEKQKVADKIGVGDVVKTYNGITFVVTKATTDGIVVGFEGEGNTCRFALSEVTKTGEHYNINEILGGLCDDTERHI